MSHMDDYLNKYELTVSQVDLILQDPEQQEKADEWRQAVALDQEEAAAAQTAIIDELREKAENAQKEKTDAMASFLRMCEEVRNGKAEQE